MYYISTTFQVPSVQLRTSSTFRQILRSKSFKHISHYVMNISCHCPRKNNGQLRFTLIGVSPEHLVTPIPATLQRWRMSSPPAWFRVPWTRQVLVFFSHKSTVPAVKRPYLKVANLPRHMQHVAALAFSERNGRCSSASWSNHACKTSSEIRPGSKLEDHPKNGHSLHVFF